MPSRKRISSYAPSVTGGGGGTSTPTVGVGPTFGPGLANDSAVSAAAKAALTMPALALSGLLKSQAAASVSALAITENPELVRSALVFSLALVKEDPEVVQSALSLGSIATVQQIAARGALTMPALALSGRLTSLAKLGGSALGAPFYQTTSTAATNAVANSIIVNKPTGVQVGDLLLAFMSTANAIANSSSFFTTPAGWTLAAGGPFPTGQAVGTAVSFGFAVMYRIADGTEGGTFTFAVTGGSGGNAEHIAIELHRINGVNTAAPINATATASLLATALVPDPVSPSVTTTVTNCMVFSFLAHYHAALSQSHTAPSGMIERADFECAVTATILGSTSDTVVFAAAGATGTAVHDCTETVSTDAVMVRVAVAPGTQVLL